MCNNSWSSTWSCVKERKINLFLVMEKFRLIYTMICSVLLCLNEQPKGFAGCIWWKNHKQKFNKYPCFVRKYCIIYTIFSRDTSLSTVQYDLSNFFAIYTNMHSQLWHIAFFFLSSLVCIKTTGTMMLLNPMVQLSLPSK